MNLNRTRIGGLLCAVALTVAATGCGGDANPSATGDTGATTARATGPCADGVLPQVASPDRSYSAPAQVIKSNCDYRATIATNFGPITVSLDPQAAPETVNSFVFLATRGFFDGLTFHRVVPGFVIQGGDPTGTGTGGPGYTLPDELPAAPGYPVGAVAMANAGPNTSGSQFFIVTGDGAANLPNAYSLFGEVTSGLDVARTIEGLADPNADPNDPAAQRPTRPAEITSIRITESSPSAAGGR